MHRRSPLSQSTTLKSLFSWRRCLLASALAVGGIFALGEFAALAETRDNAAPRISIMSDGSDAAATEKPMRVTNPYRTVAGPKPARGGSRRRTLAQPAQETAAAENSAAPAAGKVDVSSDDPLALALAKWKSGSPDAESAPAEEPAASSAEATDTAPEPVQTTNALRSASQGLRPAASNASTAEASLSEDEADSEVEVASNTAASVGSRRQRYASSAISDEVPPTPELDEADASANGEDWVEESDIDSSPSNIRPVSTPLGAGGWDSHEASASDYDMQDDGGAPVVDPMPMGAVGHEITPAMVAGDMYGGGYVDGGPAIMDDGTSILPVRSGPYYTFGMDYLYFRRSGDDLRLSTTGDRVGDFDYEHGFRGSIGQMYDALSGAELVYTHFTDFKDSISQSDPAGNLQSAFQTTLPAATLSGFNNSVSQTLTYDTTLQSLEANMKQNGWDVITALFGIRYMHLDDDLRFYSTNFVGDQGLYAVDTRTEFFGAQVGGEVFQPIGLSNFSFGARSKLAGFVTFNNMDQTFFNTAGTLLHNSDDEIGPAFLSENGVSFNWRPTPNVNVKLGYESWFVWGGTLATNNAQFLITPGLGSEINDEESFFLHGAVLGFDAKF